MPVLLPIRSCPGRGRALGLLLPLVVAVGAGGAAAQTPAPAAPLTLSATIARALTENPTIAAARLARPVLSAGVGLARERPNPELTYEGSKETPRQSIGAALPIELGGKRQRRIDLAEAGVATADADLVRIIAEVANEVRWTYFQVVAADQRTAIALDLVTLATRARDAARARFTAGDVPQADVTQAELALYSAENELLNARGEAAATRAELNALVNQPANTPVVLADTLDSGTLPTADEALARALQVNAELKVWDRRIAEQAARRAVAKSLQTPDLVAGATLTGDAEPEFRYGWRVNFGIALPVFTRHRAAVILEDAELLRLRAERDATVARLRGAIGAAHARAASARARMTQYQADILPRALDAERQAQAAYAGGQVGLAALVEALRMARESRQLGLTAGLDYQQALADLERAIGAEIR